MIILSSLLVYILHSVTWIFLSSYLYTQKYGNDAVFFFISVLKHCTELRLFVRYCINIFKLSRSSVSSPILHLIAKYFQSYIFWQNIVNVDVDFRLVTDYIYKLSPTLFIPRESYDATKEENYAGQGHRKGEKLDANLIIVFLHLLSEKKPMCSSELL